MYASAGSAVLPFSLRFCPWTFQGLILKIHALMMFPCRQLASVYNPKDSWQCRLSFRSVCWMTTMMTGLCQCTDTCEAWCKPYYQTHPQTLLPRSPGKGVWHRIHYRPPSQIHKEGWEPSESKEGISDSPLQSPNTLRYRRYNRVT